MSQLEDFKLLAKQEWAKARPSDKDEPSMWRLYNGVTRIMGSVQSTLERMVTLLNSELTFGNPQEAIDSAAPEPRRDNMDGQWVTVSITGAAQLGAGASSPIRFTHGLNQPVIAGGGIANPNLPNVTWGWMRVSHGLKLAPGANPAAAANAVHTSVHFLNGDAVDPNYIDLRVHSGLTPSAANPIVVSLFFMRAVV